MPCHAAIIKDLKTASPEDTVEKVIKLIKKSKVSTVPVVDEKGIILGIFSMKILLKNLIPVSVAMNDGIMLDIKVGAAPGVAKRLTKVKPLSVSDLMERRFQTVEPDAPLWEGVSLLTRHGGPIVVMDDKKKLIGLISYASVVDALEELHGSDS